MTPRYLYVTADGVLYRFSREGWRRYLAAVAGGVAGTGDIDAHATVLYAIEADVTELTGAQASELLVRSFHEPEPAEVTHG